MVNCFEKQLIVGFGKVLSTSFNMEQNLEFFDSFSISLLLFHCSSFKLELFYTVFFLDQSPENFQIQNKKKHVRYRKQFQLRIGIVKQLQTGTEKPASIMSNVFVKFRSSSFKRIMIILLMLLINLF